MKRVAPAMTAAGSEETAEGAVVEKTLRLNGDVYRGGFSGSSPHGKGKYAAVGAKSYANALDYYEGQWRRRNFQDGHGRYAWAANGSQYVGEWRAGVLSRRGVLIWANGRSLYDGVRDRENGGVPKGTAGGATYMRTLPERNTRLAASGIASSTSSAVTTPESKRPGQTISKGHKNYELMLQLQLGIRHSAGKSSSSAPTPMRALEQRDFDLGQKFWTRFPPEGSKVTMPHPTAEFRWKDYCPMVFRHLRKLFAVDPADYMLAICGSDALRELSSPGKSGSFFYLTPDKRFMIKTVKKSEVKLLIRMLSSYYKHVRRYKNSLITRFYGVHCVKPRNGRKVRFVVMGNLFCCSEYQIHRRFDLKGSSYGRTAGKSEDEIDETTTLKDLDLDFVFRLQSCWYADLHEQVRRDCEFLESQGIMDYSFLVGVHFCDDISASKMMGSSTFTASPKLLTKTEPLIRLGARMPARAEQASRRSECGQVHDVILYFGIIDILQDYSLRKWAEHAYKSLQTDPNSISVVNPKLYSKRFRDFVGRTFVEDG